VWNHKELAASSTPADCETVIPLNQTTEQRPNWIHGVFSYRILCTSSITSLPTYILPVSIPTLKVTCAMYLGAFSARQWSASVVAACSPDPHSTSEQTSPEQGSGWCMPVEVHSQIISFPLTDSRAYWQRVERWYTTMKLCSCKHQPFKFKCFNSYSCFPQWNGASASRSQHRPTKEVCNRYIGKVGTNKNQLAKEQTPT